MPIAAAGCRRLQAAALIGLWSFLILLPFGRPVPGPRNRERIGRARRPAGPLQGFCRGRRRHRALRIAIDRLGASRAAAVSPLSIVLAACSRSRLGEIRMRQP